VFQTAAARLRLRAKIILDLSLKSVKQMTVVKTYRWTKAQCCTIHGIALPTLPNVLLVLVPINVRAAITTTAIRTPAIAYSTVVSPRCERPKRTRLSLAPM
jgi:hypothetical protein